MESSPDGRIAGRERLARTGFFEVLDQTKADMLLMLPLLVV
jgi:hypothetical protein